MKQSQTSTFNTQHANETKTLAYKSLFLFIINLLQKLPIQLLYSDICKFSRSEKLFSKKFCTTGKSMNRPIEGLHLPKLNTSMAFLRLTFLQVQKKEN